MEINATKQGCNYSGVNLMRKQHRTVKGRCQSSIQKVCCTGRGTVITSEKSWGSFEAEAGEKVTFSHVSAMSITM